MDSLVFLTVEIGSRVAMGLVAVVLGLAEPSEPADPSADEPTPATAAAPIAVPVDSGAGR